MKCEAETKKRGFSPLSDWFKVQPRAIVDSPKTTEQLVANHEHDAFYFRALERSGIYLNVNQLKAVRTTKGPVQINAGAGSGKTTVIISRTGYLLSVEKVEPSSILLVTFTKKASDEMKERIGNLPGITEQMKASVCSGTFHSIFLRMLRENGCALEVLSSEKFRHVIIKRKMREIGLQDAFEPETVLAMISNYKNNMIEAEDLKPKSQIEEEFKRVFLAYEEWKWKEQKMDFDDILLHCYRMLRDKAEIRKHYQERFKYIICDEAQDTCPIQFQIIKLIAGESSPNLCLTGDVDQCLYGFRSAEPEFMLSFPEMYPDTQGITLDINYRSTDSVVGIGNDVIRNNKKRLKKTLKSVHSSDEVPSFVRPRDEEEEADFIVKEIKKNFKKGKKLKNMAILFRTHSSSRAVVDELVRQDLPFVLHGHKNNSFYVNSFVKPMLDLLRLSLNPNNEDALIGASPLLYLRKDAVMAELAAIKRASFLVGNEYKMTTVFEKLKHQLKPFHQRQLVAHKATIMALKMMEPVKAIEIIRGGSINYDKYLEMDDRRTLSLHKEMVKEMIDSLQNSAKRFSSVKDYIQFVDRVIEKNQQMDEMKSNPNVDAVHLMTIHASKGLEFETVYAIGVVEDVLPHSSAKKADEQNDRIRNENIDAVEMAMEEEQRILYVGLTRARQSLYISSPEIYNQKEREISRFLLDAFRI
ncbi:ATP-dependent helicase [Pseudobacillus badius]|uniref:ATP-dependent helicase n=1 Tax=Bacillus badius TaxID=1455 RepID=UPI003D340D72